MLEETEYLIDLLNGHKITWPVVLDIEVPVKEWRTFTLPTGLQTLVDLSKLEDMDKWISEYRFKPYYPYDFGIWQYSCTASIKGISQEGELSLAFVDYGA